MGLEPILLDTYICACSDGGLLGYWFPSPRIRVKLVTASGYSGENYAHGNRRMVQKLV